MALIPPFFLDCVVAIGILGSDGSKHWVATGFMYGEFQQKISEEQSNYLVFLVTNRHVFEDTKIVFVRVNTEGEDPAREFDLPLIDQAGNAVWFAHPDPDIDIAIVPVNFDSIKKRHKVALSFFQSDRQVIDRAKASELGLSEGDGVYVLGFPMSLVGGERNYVIVRQGIIARIRDTLSGASKDFLVDTTIFPGNSGGPVVLKPEAIAIQGTKVVNSAHLIGVVKGYIPYDDVAVSAQTRKPRVIFQENSGLAAAIPIDFLKETIAAWVKIHSKE